MSNIEKRYSTYVINEKNVKAKTKSHNENKQNESENRGRVKNVSEHENVDSKQWNLLKVRKEI